MATVAIKLRTFWRSSLKFNSSWSSHILGTFTASIIGKNIKFNRFSVHGRLESTLVEGRPMHKDITLALVVGC